IHPEERFRQLLGDVAALSAATRRLFTLGVVPTRPETGYGYIREGATLPAPGLDVRAFEVQRFVEKPDRATAELYVAGGQHLWNSGIFIWPAALLLEELRFHTPELAPLLPLLDDGQVDEFFERSPSLTIDVGLLERSDRVAVARANFQWDDVGAWDAVARTRSADAAGNVAQGDAWLVDARGCIAWSDDGAVVLFGTEDLVVVRANGVTLVAPRDRTAELKKLLEALPERLRQPEERG
ncbi:MAG TPA: sugar phosphate nucleotidyltransferase, partial [Longimicrobiales bacterium]